LPSRGRARASFTTAGQASRATGRKRATRRSGFTLLELIVVLGLVGVLLGLAAPSLRGFFASRQTADAAAQMLALTQLAGTRAASQGTVYRLNIDLQAGTYWLTMQQAGTFVDLNCEFGRRFQFPEGTTVYVQTPSADSPVSSIDFFPSGRTEEAAIELKGRQGEVFQLICESATEAFRVVSPTEAQRL
jgi:prepilin-type N-terminal cleavage/methylation domain-containing protein